MSTLPKWVRIAIYGGLIAVALDYYVRPTLGNTLKV